MKLIHTVDELQEVRRELRAFVFLWVNWSGPARSSEKVMRGLAGRWAMQHSDIPVPTYKVDLSDQEGAIWDAVLRWLTEEQRPLGPLMVSGAGAILWIKAGSIVLSIPNANQFEMSKLLSITEQTFNSE